MGIGTVIIMIILPYITVALFTAGMLWAIYKWAMCHQPFQVTLFPAAKTDAGAIWNMFLDTVLFRSLWRGRREVWAGAWVFHASLAFLLIGHFFGIVMNGEQFTMFGISAAQSRELSGLFGGGVGLIIMAGALYLLLRRLVLGDVRGVSKVKDYFALLLLLAIIVSGNYMRFFAEVEYLPVRDWLVGLITGPVTLKWVAPPDSIWFKLHFFFIQMLLVYFPVSKLVHTCGFFFTRWTISRTYPRQVIWK